MDSILTEGAFVTCLFVTCLIMWNSQFESLRGFFYVKLHFHESTVCCIVKLICNGQIVTGTNVMSISVLPKDCDLY